VIAFAYKWSVQNPIWWKRLAPLLNLPMETSCWVERFWQPLLLVHSKISHFCCPFHFILESSDLESFLTLHLFSCITGWLLSIGKHIYIDMLLLILLLCKWSVEMTVAVIIQHFPCRGEVEGICRGHKWEARDNSWYPWSRVQICSSWWKSARKVKHLTFFTLLFFRL